MATQQTWGCEQNDSTGWDAVTQLATPVSPARSPSPSRDNAEQETQVTRVHAEETTEVTLVYTEMEEPPVQWDVDHKMEFKTCTQVAKRLAEELFTLSKDYQPKFL